MRPSPLLLLLALASCDRLLPFAPGVPGSIADRGLPLEGTGSSERASGDDARGDRSSRDLGPTRWHLHPQPWITAQMHLHDVWGSADRVWAVGALGLVIHFDGSIWQQLHTQTSTITFTAVHGLPGGKVYAVGGDGVWACEPVTSSCLAASSCCTAQSVQSVTSDDALTLNAVWVVSASEVLLGGRYANGFVALLSCTVGPSTLGCKTVITGSGEVRGIWGGSHAVGSCPAMAGLAPQYFTNKGTSWGSQLRATPGNIPQDVWGAATAGGTVVLGVGDGCSVHPWTTAWSIHTIPGCATDLKGVWTDGQVAIAVGASGTILHTATPAQPWSPWTREAVPPGLATLRAVWASDTGNVFIVGDGGTILRNVP